MTEIDRGVFIVLEGLDHTGKTTQVALLEKKLRELDHKVIVLSFPDRTTPIGTILNAFLKGSVSLTPEVAHLLFSANRWELAPAIVKLINDGFTVICDRYAYSGIAYSVAKGTLSMEWACQSDVGLPEPDAVLFLHMEPKDIAVRKGYGDEIFDTIGFQSKVATAYNIIANNVTAFCRWERINAHDSIEVVSEKVLEIVKNVIECHHWGGLRTINFI